MKWLKRYTHDDEWLATAPEPLVTLALALEWRWLLYSYRVSDWWRYTIRRQPRWQPSATWLIQSAKTAEERRLWYLQRGLTSLAQMEDAILTKRRAQLADLESREC